MNSTLIETLRASQDGLNPQFNALRAATGALKQAMRLAGEEKADALAMQKAHAKLEQAGAILNDEQFNQSVVAFGAETQKALESLAFEFARDLKELFEQQGETVEGRPPRLVINELVLEIDMPTRRAQWVYGKELLTKPIPLSFNPILKAYEVQKRIILERSLEETFLQELYTAWNELIAIRATRPQGGRISITEAYSKFVLNRQNARFWNAPSRATFRDYDRPLFVRDIVLASANPTLAVDGQEKRLHLTIATKSQAERASQSMWIPSSPLDGEYYANITFDAE
ncbi:MAG: hypothetical protein AAF702_03595 [Chloroflexota bacterium]